MGSARSNSERALPGAGHKPAPGAGPIIIAGRLKGDPEFKTSYQLHSPILRGELDYWRALNAHWASDRTLINVEHDMEFSDELVRGLVECPHPLCTYPYRCYLRDREYYVYTPTVDGWWVEEGTEWADTSTLGFCKIAPEARTRPLRRIIWKFLEHSMCAAVTGFSQVEPDPVANRRAWHVHWPEVRHFHDYDRDVWERASEWERFCAEVGQPCHKKPSEVTAVVALRLNDRRRHEPVRHAEWLFDEGGLDAAAS